MGRDLTLVTWGSPIKQCLQAVGVLETGGSSVDLFDLRSLSPWDQQAIVASAERTGKLVVVHEDARTTGFGQSIITEMTSHPDRFNLFLSSPQLVARKDVHIPYNPILEYAVLPDLEEVLAAIRLTME